MTTYLNKIHRCIKSFLFQKIPLAKNFTYRICLLLLCFGSRPAQAKFSELTGNGREAISVPAGDVMFIHDALFQEINAPSDTLWKIEGVAIVKNVELLSNTVQTLIEVNEGSLVISLDKPGDYFRILNTQISSVSETDPLIRLLTTGLGGRTNSIGTDYMEILTTEAVYLTSPQLGGNMILNKGAILFLGAEGTISKMAGNGKNPLISGTGKVYLGGGLEFYIDNLVRADELQFNEITNLGGTPLLSIKIKSFGPDAEDLEEEWQNTTAKSNNAIRKGDRDSSIATTSGGRLEANRLEVYLINKDNPPFKIRPLVGYNGLVKENNSGRYYFYRYIFGKAGNSFTGTFENYQLHRSSDPQYICGKCYEVSFGNDYYSNSESGGSPILKMLDGGLIRYHFPRDTKFLQGHSGRSLTVPPTDGSDHYDILVLDGHDSPVIFDGLLGGALTVGEWGQVILSGSVTFNNVSNGGNGNAGVITLDNPNSKLWLTLPEVGDRIAFSGSGTKDIAGSGTLALEGVSGTEFILSSGIELSSPLTISGPVEVKLGETTIRAASIEFQTIGSLTPQLYFTFSQSVGGKIVASSGAIEGTVALIPRVGDAGLTTYTFAQGSIKDFSPSVAARASGIDGYYSASISQEDKKILQFDFTKAINKVIAGPQSQKIVLGSGVLLGQGFVEPISFSDLEDGGALDIGASGIAYIQGPASFSSISHSGRGVLDVATSGRLEISLPETGDYLRFRGTGSDSWDIYNIATVTLEGVAGSTMQFSRGIGGTGGTVTFKGPVSLDFRAGATIDQKYIYFTDAEGYPEIILSSGGITVQNDGTLAGSLRVALDLTASEATSLLTGGKSSATKTYINYGGTTVLTTYQPILVPRVLGGGEFVTAGDSGQGSNAKDSFLVLPRNITLSGARSTRTVVYGAQVAANGENSLSFKALSSSGKKGGLFYVAPRGRLELTAKSKNPLSLTGNSAQEGGAIYVDQDDGNGSGIATFQGSFTFSGNSADSANGGGSIYNRGVLRFREEAGDVVTFEATTTPLDSKNNGIRNDGTIELEGPALLTSLATFRLGKNVLFLGSDPTSATGTGTGKLILSGGVELILDSAIIQHDMKFLREGYYTITNDGASASSDIFPAITFGIEKFDTNNATDTRSGRGGEGGYLETYTVAGDFISARPLLTSGIINGKYDKTKEYRYLYFSNGLAPDQLSCLGCDYPVHPSRDTTISHWAQFGKGAPSRRGLILFEFLAGNTTTVIEGTQSEGRRYVWANQTLSNLATAQPLVWQKGLALPLVYASGGTGGRVDYNIVSGNDIRINGVGGGRVTLTGNMVFDSMGSSNDDGVLGASVGGGLLLAPGIGNSIVFKDTGAKADIYNDAYAANNNDVGVFFNLDSKGARVDEASKIVLSKGLAGKGRLRVKGGYWDEALVVNGKIKQRRLEIFGQRPLFLFEIKPDGKLSGSIEVEDVYGENSYSVLNVAARVADGVNLSAPPSRKEFQFGKGIPRSRLDMRLQDRLISYRGVEYDVLIETKTTTVSNVNCYGETTTVGRNENCYDNYIVLEGDLAGDISEPFIVPKNRYHLDGPNVPLEKQITNANFSGLDGSGYEGTEPSGGAGALSISNGATAVIGGETTTFQGNTGKEGKAGAIFIDKNGELRIELESESSKVIFQNNKVKGPSGEDTFLDIVNNGIIEMDTGSLVFESSGIGIDGKGTLTMGGTSTLSVGSAAVRQQVIEFEDGAKFVLKIDEFDNNISGDIGGHLYIFSGGTLKGSPLMSVKLSPRAEEQLAKQAKGGGGSLEYDYVYRQDETANIVDFHPSFSKKLISFDADGTLLGVKIVFSREAAGLSGSGKSVALSTESLGTAAKEAVENIINGDSDGEEDDDSNSYYIDTVQYLVEIDDDIRKALESGDVAELKKACEQNVPDPHISSGTKDILAPVQLLDDMVTERMLEDSLDEKGLSSENLTLLVAAAGANRKLSYGALRGRMSRQDSPNDVWSRMIGSFGSQKLNGAMSTSSFNFILGYDRRLLPSFRAGVTYSFGSGSSKGELRNKSVTMNALSIYGDYDFRDFKLAELHLSALMAYGFATIKDNRLSGGGGVLHLASTVGYRVYLESKVGLIPELTIRYSWIHQGELEGTVNKISALGRHVLSMVPALRATYVLRERYELGARLGFGYNVYDGGDSSYTVISQNVVRGQIAEIGKGGARFSTELGLSLGYRINSAIRTSIRYSGRYSADLGNSSFGLEGSFKF